MRAKSVKAFKHDGGLVCRRGIVDHGQNDGLRNHRRSAVHASTKTLFARRAFHGLCCLVSLALGLASRHGTSWLAPSFGKYPGDALWAMMVFFGFGFVRPMSSVVRVAIAAFVFSCAIELLKLCSAPWLVDARRTPFGSLVFGHVFSFGNLAAYAAGIALGSCVAAAFLTSMQIRAGWRTRA